MITDCQMEVFLFLNLDSRQGWMTVSEWVVGEEIFFIVNTTIHMYRWTFQNTQCHSCNDYLEHSKGKLLLKPKPQAQMFIVNNNEYRPFFPATGLPKNRKLHILIQNNVCLVS